MKTDIATGRPRSRSSMGNAQHRLDKHSQRLVERPCQDYWSGLRLGHTAPAAGAGEGVSGLAKPGITNCSPSGP